MRSRIAVSTALLALCLPLAAGARPAPASDGAIDNAKATHAHDQHGGTAGHLAPTRSNVRLVGKAAINQDQQGRVADVGVFGDFAYLAAFAEPNCQKGGVYVFDIADATKPKQINFIRTSNDSFVGEGVQVIHITTPFFTGDVLAMNNEICNEDQGDEKHPNGGMTLVDVTNPKVHKYLAEHVGDAQPDGSVNEIHSVFMWDAGARAFAVIVDDEEATDVDIMEITDPRNPVKIAEYDLSVLFPVILQPGTGLDEVFLHDMIVKQVSPGVFHMLLSYWDAGYVVLDVTNPLAPIYKGDSDYTFPDPEALESGFNVDPEGNGHEAEFTLDNQYIVGADEDFGAFKVTATNDDDSTTFTAIQGSNVPGVPQGGSIAGDTVYVGRACNADTAVPAGGAGKIAVAVRGVCTFQEKYDNVVAAGGYEALIVANRENAGLGDGCDTLVTMLVSGDTLPAFFVTRRVGFDFFDVAYNHAACVAGSATEIPTVAVGTSGDDVTLESFFDGWGYVHLFRNQAGKLPELDTYAIPEAHNPAFANGFGDLSVHEAATSLTDPRLVYFAYYAGGFRVARIVPGAPNEDLVEVGRFIDVGGNNFWGLQVFDHNGDEFVAASDRDFGLYIFEYTGP
jgi:hypothetical protein